MKFIEKHLFTILAAVVIVFMAIFGSRFTGSSGKVLDVVLFAYFGAVLLVIPAMAMCTKILEKLKELAPGTGLASGEVQASAPIDPYPQRPHRNDIELALVHSLSALMHDRHAMSGAETGAFIRAVADSILGVGQQFDVIGALTGVKDARSLGGTNIPDHSVQCLYHYALARLGLKDSDELRVIFWDAHDALLWDEKTDRHQMPALADVPCPACGSNADSAMGSPS